MLKAALATAAQACLQRLEPERAHRLALAALRSGLTPQARWRPAPSLVLEFCGCSLPHPLGLAAGFDKNAEAVAPLLALGFSSVEVGAVTPESQAGNPPPRLWRLAQQQALVNRMGFNNDGAGLIATRLRSLPAATPVGVNIGVNSHSSNPSSDLRSGLQSFTNSLFLSLNLSSPNTSGLRAWLQPQRLAALLAELAPLPRHCFLKLSPDQSDEEISEVLELARRHGVSGFIISNSSNLDAQRYAQRQHGGLSGKPLYQRSTALLRRVYGVTKGELTLVGVGGVGDVDSAWGKITAGADYLQLYSAFVFQGPRVLERICCGLAQRLQAHGCTSINQAVGGGGG